MRKLLGVLLVGCELAVPSAALGNQGETPDARRKLFVGTKESPPFSFKSPDGRWCGISIELWVHLTDELNLEYEFRPMTLGEMLAGLESGDLDAAVAAISVTAERHQRVEFCHPHFTTGLGIAVAAKRHTSNWMLLRRVASSRLLAIVGGMIVTVVVCGLLFWLFERKVNENMFGGRRRQGIGMGVWWSTIMLLGHKGIIPVSIWGRVLAASAMLFSILLLSLLTGVIASVLTVQQLDAGITHPSELTKVRVVTVAGSTSADYLRRRRIAFQTLPTAEAMLRSLAKGEADAAVYDEALLKYLAITEFAENIRVLPVSFNTQEYAIALSPESPLRKPLNEALLRFRASDGWDDLTYRYLGE